MARKTERAPVYLSARSADVILSEIRPTRLKPDALQSINALLDELLHLILKTAKSFSPAKLKDSLLKLLQTPLGKEAVLEAELELRNHRDRGAVSALASEDGATLDNASIEPAFELLRTRCEACTTLNEVDEDVDNLDQSLSKGDGSRFKKAAVNGAVYYLTAILEHICQHILSNVGRVVTRDSSRTLATAHDLYIGLCEDDTIYPLVSAMSVFEVISAQSSVLAPKKGRTSTSHQEQASISTSRTSSPIPQPQADGRTSRASESHAPSRSSFEKARALRIFRSGSVSDSGHGNDPAPLPAVPHKRSQSQQSSSRKHSTSVEDDGKAHDENNQQFDELMRSGETMKVSLTPDRLQSMEAYKQKISQLAGGGNTQREEPQSPLAHSRKASGRPFATNTRVAAIEEGEEDAPGVPDKTSSPRGSSQDAETGKVPRIVPPTRTSSKRIPGLPELPETDTSGGPKSGMGKVNRSNGRARNRDSLDLDDIMNGLDDTGRQPDFTLLPKTATTTAKSDTRDLISFLESGPPEEFTPSRSTGSNGIASESVRKTGGRFRSMVSRLRPRASTDFNKADEAGFLKPPLRSKGSSPDVGLSSSGSVPYPRPPRISPTTSPSSYNDPFKDSKVMDAPRPSSASRKPVPIIDSSQSKSPHPNPNGLSPAPLAPVDTGAPSPTAVEPTVQVTPTKPARPGRSAARDTVVNGHSPVENGSAKHEPKRIVNAQPTQDRSGIGKQFADQLVKVLGKAETAEECRLVVQALLRQAGHTVTIQAETIPPPQIIDSDNWPLVEMLLDS